MGERGTKILSNGDASERLPDCPHIYSGLLSGNARRAAGSRNALSAHAVGWTTADLEKRLKGLRFNGSRHSFSVPAKTQTSHALARPPAGPAELAG